MTALYTLGLICAFAIGWIIASSFQNMWTTVCILRAMRDQNYALIQCKEITLMEPEDADKTDP